MPEDCWIILGGRVYNVTPFISKHPGGYTTIFKCAGTGQDHQDDFSTADHSESAKNMLQKYYIGDLAK